RAAAGLARAELAACDVGEGERGADRAAAAAVARARAADARAVARGGEARDDVAEGIEHPRPPVDPRTAAGAEIRRCDLGAVEGRILERPERDPDVGIAVTIVVALAAHEIRVDALPRVRIEAGDGRLETVWIDAEALGQRTDRRGFDEPVGEGIGGARSGDPALLPDRAVEDQERGQVAIAQIAPV